MKAALARWAVCLLPKRLASYLIWNVRLPPSWCPYVFERSMGCGLFRRIPASMGAP